MELYSTFQIKDHYYWDDTPKAEVKAETSKSTAIKNPTYRTTKVRESDGSVTYYTGQVRREAIRIDGIMI